MMRMLDGKVAVVTGAASGIGRAIAVAFAAAGCRHLVLGDLDEVGRGDRSVVDELGSTVSVEFQRCDVTVRSDLARLIAASERVGGPDVMVNNAGVFRRHEFLDATEEDLEAVMAVNVNGAFFGAQEAARAMVAHGRGGSIVNLGSSAADHGGSGQAAYHASKGAVKALTLALAAELGPRGIRVNAVHPGAVDTAMFRDDVGGDRDLLAARAALRRLVTPEDVARVVAYLGSDLSGGVTGSAQTVDCGLFVSG